MQQNAPNTGSMDEPVEKPRTAAELLLIAKQQMEEAEQAVAAEQATDQQQERIYNSDQLSIVLCAEAVDTILEGMPESRLAIRLRQVKFWLYYLGGMPEFLPVQQPDTRLSMGQPSDEEADVDGIPDTIQLPTDEEKNLDEISAKLSALTHREVMKKEDEPPKKNMLESGLDKLMPDFMKKKPDEKSVNPDHQPTSLG